MKFSVTMCMLIVLVGLTTPSVLVAQDKIVQKSHAVKTPDQAKAQLWRDVSLARRNGDLQRYGELMAKIEASEKIRKVNRPVGPIGMPPSVSEVATDVSSPLWGNDVLVRSGDLGWNGDFNIATASDTLGNIYAACSIPPTASLNGGIYVYKSTDVGRTWGMVPSGGIVFGRPHAIQSFGLAVGDTADGRWMIHLLLVLVDSVYAPFSCGDLYSCSFLDDGSGWRYRLILAADANTAYRSATVTTDAFYYVPKTTWFYGATEQVTPSTGASRGIVAFSTRNNGDTWQYIDSTVSGGTYDDRNPRIGFMQSQTTTDDSVFIAVSEAYTSTDHDVYVYLNKYTYEDVWDYARVSTTGDEELDPDIAVSTLGESMMVTFAKVQGGSTDALYAYSTDGFMTKLIDTISANESGDEYFITASVVADHGNDEWRVAYKWGADTVMYKATVGATSFKNVGPTVVNQFMPTGTLRPCIGAHTEGIGYWYGHVVYAGWGPTNMYFDGSDIALGVKREETGVPTHFSLGQNFPNPFNPATTITYDVPVQTMVTLKVYNVIGQEVASLVNEPMAVGSYSVRFDASSLSSGTYFYRISAGSFVEIRKMVLLK